MISRSFSNLKDPAIGDGRFVFNAWLWASLPALALVVLASWLGPENLFNRVDKAVLDSGTSTVTQMLTIVLIAPWLETVGMLVPFAAMGALKVPETAQCIVQGGLWGVLHGLIAPGWAFAPAWLFFIFARVYLTQSISSKAKALTMTAAVHTLHNGLVCALIFIGPRS